MIYYGNPCNTRVLHSMLEEPRIRMIDTPKQGSRKMVEAAHQHNVRWCADNGAFSDQWTAHGWWTWIEAKAEHLDSCDFATAPDIVGDAEGTWERARLWIPMLRDLGYKVAYVGQNGITTPPWDHMDILFLGGDDTWKLGPEGRRVTAEATRLGIPVHMGRVNSLKRLRYAENIGCTSADGTCLTRGPDKVLPQLRNWIRATGHQGLWDTA